MVDGPESHGSTRIEKVPDDCGKHDHDGDGDGGDGGRFSFSRGEKVNRNVVSPLRCFTVTDMASASASASASPRDDGFNF